MTVQTEASPSTELRDFALVVRQALLMIVAFVERRYGLPARTCTDCPLTRSKRLNVI